MKDVWGLWVVRQMKAQGIRKHFSQLSDSLLVIRTLILVCLLPGSLLQEIWEDFIGAGF